MIGRNALASNRLREAGSVSAVCWDGGGAQSGGCDVFGPRRRAGSAVRVLFDFGSDAMSFARARWACGLRPSAGMASAGSFRSAGSAAPRGGVRTSVYGRVHTHGQARTDDADPRWQKNSAGFWHGGIPASRRGAAPGEPGRLRTLQEALQRSCRAVGRPSCSLCPAVENVAREGSSAAPTTLRMDPSPQTRFRALSL